MPDAPLDDSAVEEAALIERGLGYLRPVWSDDHWRVYEVVDAAWLVDGPAEVVAVDIDSVTLDVTARGDVVVRVRESPFWRHRSAGLRRARPGRLDRPPRRRGRARSSSSSTRPAR